MKLSKLYSNQPEMFFPIHFRDGLNVVLAEIRLPDNKNKATHNLGKSLLGRLIDFCLLAGVDKSFFLRKHDDLFQDFVFFLEIELFDHSYLTIRRAVKEYSKISFKKHKKKNQDFSWMTDGDSDWDHENIGFKQSKEILDGLLDLDTVKPWDFRKPLGYLIRSQDDYSSVYQLHKFKGRHVDWKPYLTKLLGFDGALLEKIYRLEMSIDSKKTEANAFSFELKNFTDQGNLDGILLIKRREVTEKTALLDRMDFYSEDFEKTKKLVDEIDMEIADLNSERYRVMQSQKNVKKSLEDGQILFDPEKAQVIFKESGIFFEGQIKKDFVQLLDFNKAISSERRQYLQEELEEIDRALIEINEKIQLKSNERSGLLAFLEEANIFEKYKRFSDELVVLRSEVESLERLRSGWQRHKEMISEIDTLKENRKLLQKQMERNIEEESNIEKEDSLFSRIRLYFDEIVKHVINQNALLSVFLNNEGHPEFQSPILDEKGNPTSAGEGHSYNRLLCVAFDLAVMRGHLNTRYPRFIFHDGILESLEPRKKENLFEIVKQYTQQGIQHIVTLLDSEVPHGATFFDDSEVILRLHDEDKNGRLFKMEAW